MQVYWTRVQQRKKLVVKTVGVERLLAIIVNFMSHLTFRHIRLSEMMLQEICGPTAREQKIDPCDSSLEMVWMNSIIFTRDYIVPKCHNNYRQYRVKYNILMYFQINTGVKLFQIQGCQWSGKRLFFQVQGKVREFHKKAGNSGKVRKFCTDVGYCPGWLWYLSTCELKKRNVSLSATTQDCNVRNKPCKKTSQLLSPLCFDKKLTFYVIK